uniref:GAF domain-containing protein n=1 Tax=Anaplasma marginale TaxID=770 RepID=UPI0005B55828
RKSDRDDISAISGKTSSSIKLENIDLATILETNEALSSELDLAKLLNKLIEIVIENSGAQKGCLILLENNKLAIEALKTAESQEIKVLQSIPIDAINVERKTTFLAVTIVNYVARTLKSEILDNAATKERYAKDPYIVATAPKSILCIPLINQSKLIGLVYLENNLTTGAFTSDRIESVKAIASQAAISIQNARLYKERIEAEAALSQKDKQLTKFIEAMPVGVFVSNAKGEPYYLNQTAKQILGKGVESIKQE